MELLIIEDDIRVSELLKRAMEAEGCSVTLAHDGMTGFDLATTKAFDLVILDVILPKMDGITLCKELRKYKSNIPILMLTALGTTDDKVEGLDSGADDYMVKPFEIRELFARTRVLLKRYQKSEESVQHLRYADLEMDLKAKVVTRNGSEINLTPKEFNLLEYMLRNPERVLSRMEISEEVWDTHFDTGTNFIDVYINYLRKKIDKGYDNKLIHTKSGMGFYLKSL